MADEAGSSRRDDRSPLRVLMVLESDFTRRGGGGAESQVRTLALYLRRIGHEVTILTPLARGGPQVVAERCHGIPVARLSYPRWHLIGGALMCLRLAAFLWQHGRRYDAWHVHIGHHLGAVSCLIGSWLGKPVVVKISGWWELERGLLAPGGSPLRSVARRWLKRASAVQALSTRIATELKRQGFPPERILVLPNAVDTSRFHPRTLPRAAGGFTVLFVGRLVPEKGLDTLLDAWAEVFGERSDTRLQLIGEGSQGAELREQALRLGIASQVEFVGHCDRVEDAMGQADAGVLPSRIEGLSNTLLEFMACGLPVVASQVSGSEDFVVTGRNGWLIPPTKAALRASLSEAAAASSERLASLGRQARADVEAVASLQAVVGRLLELYRGAHPRELAERG